MNRAVPAGIDLGLTSWRPRPGFDMRWRLSRHLFALFLLHQAMHSGSSCLVLMSTSLDRR